MLTLLGDVAKQGCAMVRSFSMVVHSEWTLQLGTFVQEFFGIHKIYFCTLCELLKHDISLAK